MMVERIVDTIVVVMWSKLRGDGKVKTETRPWLELVVNGDGGIVVMYRLS